MNILKVNRKISGYVPVSKFMQDFFADYIQKNKPIRVIYSPVNFSYYDLKEGSFEKFKSLPVFLFLGRLSYEKGLDLALDAIKALNAKIIIIGDGVLKDYCKEKAIEIGKINGTNKVEFFGWQDEEIIAREMHRCWAILLPSRVQESGGLVIMEAAKYSLPAIVSQSGAFTESVNDKKDGYHFKPCNLLTLMKAMYRIIAEPEKTKKMGLDARQKFEKTGMSVENHAKELEKFYYEVI